MGEVFTGGDLPRYHQAPLGQHQARWAQGRAEPWQESALFLCQVEPEANSRSQGQTVKNPIGCLQDRL